MAENDNIINHVPNSESGTESIGYVVHSVQTAIDLPKNLTEELMTKVASVTNLKTAFKAVKRNKGAPGIDKRTIYEVQASINETIIVLHNTLLDGSYTPLPVRGVDIPKSNGKTRQSSRRTLYRIPLSHHRTSVVAYGGFRFVCNKSIVNGKQSELFKPFDAKSLVNRLR